MSASHDLRVSAPQGIFLSDLNTKFRGYVGGFGSGKTFVGCLDLGLFAGANPKTVQGYFAPTYRDIRDTFWPTMDEAGTLLGFTVKIKKADKEVDLYRGRAYYGTIICRSMDDPGSIVGFKIARALVDEIDILPKDKATDAWRKIIARMRLVLPGVVNGIGVTTTPEGFRFVYDTFARDPRPGYSMVQASTYENERYLPPDYITSLRETYPQELIDAYLMGEFVNLTAGTVYRNYDRAANRSTEAIQDREPLHIGQDFNVGQMASVVHVERENGWHAVDELKGLTDTPRLIEVLGDRYPGHKLTIYPDASGGSRKTVNASTSDIELLRKAGHAIRAPKANPPVKDRILAVNTAFSKRRYWVNDAKCKTYAEALEQQAYDKNGDPDKTAGLDHHPDAGGYFVHQKMPVVKPTITSRELRL
ncbi:terminase family protein [Maritimibacter sp. UBA3975]|uniref:terminase large subunit domain-containing protein n=1 Tax=Maritimibacter sp. UBA3975 TaxID=1946833 RepID=UPI000C0B39C8|nr:terminase family protein [Maritimibacter sp. UBA3975]MAM60850.1 terminase [Maritimibacter sp.]|tara:strand:+ start:5360 stop:6616 length:1257 start_codon:yes stop_codon:yes gene_type:complete